jgi:hypothetical protein
VVSAFCAWCSLWLGRGLAEAEQRPATLPRRFLTEPLDRKAELRCYLRDPDGYLVEIGQATGMLEGIYADPTPGGE